MHYSLPNLIYASNLFYFKGNVCFCCSFLLFSLFFLNYGQYHWCYFKAYISTNCAIKDR